MPDDKSITNTPPKNKRPEVKAVTDNPANTLWVIYEIRYPKWKGGYLYNRGRKLATEASIWTYLKAEYGPKQFIALEYSRHPQNTNDRPPLCVYYFNVAIEDRLVLTGLEKISSRTTTAQLAERIFRYVTKKNLRTPPPDPGTQTNSSKPPESKEVIPPKIPGRRRDPIVNDAIKLLKKPRHTDAEIVYKLVKKHGNKEWANRDDAGRTELAQTALESAKRRIRQQRQKQQQKRKLKKR